MNHEISWYIYWVSRTHHPTYATSEWYFSVGGTGFEESDQMYLVNASGVEERMNSNPIAILLWYCTIPWDSNHFLIISIGHKKLKAVQKFIYLGFGISSDVKIDKVDNRFNNTNSAISRFYKRKWKSNNIRKINKVQFYKTVILSNSLFGVDTWETYRRHIHLLRWFHERCLHNIFNCNWNDFIWNIENLETEKNHKYQSNVAQNMIELCRSCHQDGKVSPPKEFTFQWPLCQMNATKEIERQSQKETAQAANTQRWQQTIIKPTLLCPRVKKRNGGKKRSCCKNCSAAKRTNNSAARDSLAVFVPGLSSLASTTSVTRIPSLIEERLHKSSFTKPKIILVSWMNALSMSLLWQIIWFFFFGGSMYSCVSMFSF